MTLILAFLLIITGLMMAFGFWPVALLVGGLTLVFWRMTNE